jgi:hypothetical protein
MDNPRRDLIKRGAVDATEAEIVAIGARRNLIQQARP